MKFFDVKRVSVKKKVWRVSGPVAAPLDIWTYSKQCCLACGIGQKINLQPHKVVDDVNVHH
jgi:hypothetical protein